MTTETVRCGKCAGSKVYVFRSGERGVCFACNGEGTTTVRYQAAGKPRSEAAARESIRLTLRTMYKNAQRPSDAPCHCSYEMATDGSLWTRENLDNAFAMVPGSREAFRSLGWPV